MYKKKELAKTEIDFNNLNEQILDPSNEIIVNLKTIKIITLLDMISEDDYFDCDYLINLTMQDLIDAEEFIKENSTIDVDIDLRELVMCERLKMLCVNLKNEKLINKSDLF